MRYFPLLLLFALAVALAPAAAQQPGKTANRNIRFGIPGEAKADPVKSKDAYLIQRPQYVLSYNDRRKSANWVSWQLTAKDLGRVRRGMFNVDPALPKGFDRVTPATYTGSGFDRGHLCPSGDRTDAEANNDATFFMTNVIPQSPNCNQKGWERLESYCRDLAARGKELYIVAGPHGIGGIADNGTKKATVGRAAPFVTVPTAVWKVILVLDRGAEPTARTRTIAVWMPNDPTVTDDWPRYRVPVKEVEKKTGLKFFPLLPEDVATAIKANADDVKVVVPPR